jgi:hypothetical protein
MTAGSTSSADSFLIDTTTPSLSASISHSAPDCQSFSPPTKTNNDDSHENHISITMEYVDPNSAEQEIITRLQNLRTKSARRTVYGLPILIFGKKTH